MKGGGVYNTLVASFSIRSDLGPIQRFIVAELARHPHEIAKVAAARFGITRQAVGRHLRNLVAQGVLQATGETRNRQYTLVTLGTKSTTLQNTQQLADDVIYPHALPPLLQ